MTSPRVTIVILCWNRWPLTALCLETLRSNTDLSAVDVLVVDNGSEDETSERLRSIPWIRTIRNDRNLGYVRGNNVGIRAADPASDVILLNNDVQITQADWLEKLRAAADSAPDVGVVGCRLVLPDGRLLHAGTYILPDTMWGQQIGALETDVNQYQRLRDVEGIVFACAYIRRDALTALGGLSESYTSYFEDTDFCLRARAAGFRTLCCGAVTLVHAEHGSTSNQPDLFRGIFSKSRRTFSRTWKSALEARYTRQLGWQSIMNISTGYAMSSREIVRALDRARVRVGYEYVYGRGTPYPLAEHEGMNDHMLDVVAARGVPWRPKVSVVYAQGDVFHRNRGRYRIGYTMLEVDGFPADWVDEANEMDEVWVPTRFNRDGLFRCGVTKPIHVMPLGVDVDHFHPAIRAHRNPHGDYVFLSSFEWGERKQPELLMRVFNATFRSGDPVLLVCKVMHRSETIDLKEQVRALGLDPFGGRIAFIYNRDFAYAELGSLYRSADCYVSAGRGEGWDMPLMEAMACGLPTIATDWGAHTEFAHEGICYPLATRGTIPAQAICPYYDGFSWADPDPEHLGALLERVYENRAEAEERGRRAATEMASAWTWDRAAARIVARLETIGS